MEEISILPCPHCGNSQIDFCYEGNLSFYYCADCGLCGPRADKILAADRWNGLPRRLKFTRKKPTIPDFYWHKDGKMLSIGEIMELSGSLFCHFAGENEPQLLDLIDGEWAGPIPEPEEP